MFKADPTIYEKPQYVVLDLEVAVHDGGFGSALDARNQIFLACWKKAGGSVKHKFGNELEQNELIEAVRQADFIVAHNAKYELAWLRRMGVDIEELVVFDTMLAEYILAGNLAAQDSKDGAARIELSLDSCCRRRGLTSKDPVVSLWMKNGISVAEMPASWLLQRCRKDVEDCETLFLSQRESLKRSNRLNVLYTRCLLTPVLVDVESQGMKLDKDRVSAIHTKTGSELIMLESQLSDLTGGINWNSSKQVGEYLYDKLGFRELTNRRGEPIRTESGKRSTDSKTLARLSATTDEQAQFVDLRGRASKLQAALSKNLDYFKHACETNDGVMYGRFNQAVTATHRLSSAGVPSEAGSVQFQNMPRAFKSLFCARQPDWLVMEIDGSQLEFRVAAFLGNDRQAREDLLNPGWDSHITTASYMYGIPYEKLYQDWKAGDKKADAMRTAAKAETFKPLYGGSKGTKAQERWYAGFRERYKDLAAVQSGWVAEVLLRKALVTPWGLRYYWPKATVSNTGYCNVTASVYNYPIQCVDAETEYFDGQVWRKISHYGGGPVTQIDGTGAACAKAPINYVKNAPAPMWHFKKQGIDMMLTDEHRVLLRTEKSDNLKWTTAAELAQRVIKNSRGVADAIPTTFTQNGAGHQYTDTELRLLVAFQADGTTRLCRGTGQRNRKWKFPHSFHFSKRRKIDRLCGLLDIAGLPYQVRQYEYDACIDTDIPFATKRLQDKLTLSRLTKHEARVLYDESFLWDGCVTGNSFSSYVPDQLDFMQYCAALCGIRGNVSAKAVQFSEEVWPTFKRDADKSPCVSLVSARESYCFTTETGAWLARRNGQIFVTGNCLATAEIIPVALVYFWHATRELRSAGKLRIVNSVHDSVVVELAPDVLEEVKQAALDSFGPAVYYYLKEVYNMDFNVALGVGVKVGTHWGDGEESSYNVLLDGTIQKVK